MMTLKTCEQDFRKYLSQLTRTEISGLLSCFEELEYSELSEPTTGLVMMTTLDAFNSPFHLGEILVTQTELVVDDIRAQATVMGDHGEAALVAATLNALSRHPRGEELSEKFTSCWSGISQKVAARVEEEMVVSASTKVAFESMAEEEEI